MQVWDKTLKNHTIMRGEIEASLLWEEWDQFTRHGCLCQTSSKKIYVIGFPVDHFEWVPSVLCNFIRSLIHGQDGRQSEELAKCIIAGKAMVTASLHIDRNQIMSFACRENSINVSWYIFLWKYTAKKCWEELEIRFQMKYTPTLHLKIKKLLMNASRDFNSILDTINPIGPAKYFSPNSSSLSVICDSFKWKFL